LRACVKGASCPTSLSMATSRSAMG
jgi:hypothetical protein